MKILLIGGGGREHALAQNLGRFSSCTEIFVAPGNAGTAEESKCRNISLNVQDRADLDDFLANHDIDLAVIGPEAPLVSGMADALRERSIPTFGPGAKAAELEASKAFAKAFCMDHGIATAHADVYDNEGALLKAIKGASFPLVLKADGLAAGKGVCVCQSQDEALAFAKACMSERKFGDAGQRVLLEEALEGFEASFFVLMNENGWTRLPPCKDHKRLLEGGKGPNTGGMGVIAPSPDVDDALISQFEKTILKPTLEGLKDKNLPYRGVLYFGVMVTADGPKLLEYNVRFGDPEAQTLLPMITSDLPTLFLDVAEGRAPGDVVTSKNKAINVTLACGSYPQRSDRGTAISGTVTHQPPSTFVYHGGTTQGARGLETAGGRIFSITSLAPTFKEARRQTYQAAEAIVFEGKRFRTDIGKDL